MVDFVVALFVDHIKIIYPATGLLAAAGYWMRHRSNFHLHDSISAGALGGCMPVGVLLILAAFDSDLTDKLRDFPLALGIIGLAYIAYAAAEIARKYKK